MADESLNVKVVPEIDDAEIEHLSQQLSNIMVNVSGTVNGTSSSASSEGKSAEDAKQDASEAIKEGITKGATDLSQKKDTQDKLFQPLTQGQMAANKMTAEIEATSKDSAETQKGHTTIFGKLNEGLATAGATAVLGWGILKKLFNIIESSAGPLKDVMSLISTIFSLFLLPLNIALTQIMIPYVQQLATTMSTWVSEMMTIYSEEGLGGIIVKTFGKLVEVFLPLLITVVEYTGQVIRTVIRQIWNSGNLGKAVIVLATTIPAFLLVAKAFQVISQLHQIKVETELASILTQFFTSNIENGLQTASLGAIAAPVIAIAAAVLAIVALIKAMTGANIFGFAEGGVIEPNNPHYVLVGDNREEQEIISPKSTIVSAVNEALTSNTITSKASSAQSVTINATFNITGNNAEDIAEEVERQLSKMMDNSATRWGV